ncbi:metallophosphoesterase family protein [Noviherbaspirillum aerium]|uniref:metallophosphoesterase family protein n=1 Tax=Noviherbaspirillum aerium TaxID=2588497 RepID=UPI00124DB624|nr:DNA repair exonuclease [Noviherbaspirillum aerium]
MKFIHAADLHIDSPLRGLDAHDGAPVDRLRSATRRAFVALIDLAIAQNVDFVILAGDIFDGNWPDFHTGLFFREQLVRLRQQGIAVVIARGNHDAESQITKQLPAVEGVHIFSTEMPETVVREDLGVALHGYSFPQRAVTHDVVPDFPRAVPGMFNIGVLHTSLTGRDGHDDYAPTSVEMIMTRGYDYFALGHVHAREVVRDANPRIVFPGNLQGRKSNETGPKGCELVTVVDGRIVGADFVPLDVVRWHRLELDVTGIETLDGLVRAFHHAVKQLTDGATDRMHAIRLIVHGESPLNRIEAEQPGTIGAAIIAALQDMESLEIWLERVKTALRTPLDREQAALRTDAVGEVVSLVNELMDDEDRLADWIARELSGLSLPPTLQDLDPTAVDAAALRAMLTDAESTVLAHLGAVEINGEPA